MKRREFLIAGSVAGIAIAGMNAGASAQLFHEVADLGNQGVLYTVRLPVGGAVGLVTVTAAVLPRATFRASIAAQADRAKALTAVRDFGRLHHAVVAINGGRFNGAFAPDGLLIVDGQTVGRKRSDWPGMLVIDRDGRASVTTAPDLRGARWAVQAWPVLVRDGGALGVTREDHDTQRRTAIAQSGDVIIAMVTSPVSYFQLATLLVERPDAFYLHQIDTAIALSGAATTSFYARFPNGSEDVQPAFWPNRDVVLFNAR